MIGEDDTVESYDLYDPYEDDQSEHGDMDFLEAELVRSKFRNFWFFFKISKIYFKWFSIQMIKKRWSLCQGNPNKPEVSNICILFWCLVFMFPRQKESKRKFRIRVTICHKDFYFHL